MKVLTFIIDLPFRFVFAFLGFTFLGWIGWVGVLYCLYMTIDGALYRAGRKDIGGYARFTATDEQLADAEFQQALRNLERERGKE